MHRWLAGVLVAVLSVAPEAGDAQAAVGIRAGYRSSDLTTSQDTEGMGGMVVGGYFGFGLSNRLALQFEAVYGTRGAKELGLGDGELASDGTPVRVEMDYIEIPVLLRAGVPGERFLPSFFVGPYVGFLLGCEITPPDAGSRKCDTADATERFGPRATEFGLLGGLGLDFALGESTVFLDARYTLGLLSIESGDSPLDAHHNGLAISGGFAVPIGR